MQSLLTVSDGTHWLQVMLAKHLNIMITDRQDCGSSCDLELWSFLVHPWVQTHFVAVAWIAAWFASWRLADRKAQPRCIQGLHLHYAEESCIVMLLRLEVTCFHWILFKPKSRVWNLTHFACKSEFKHTYMHCGWNILLSSLLARLWHTMWRPACSLQLFASEAGTMTLTCKDVRRRGKERAQIVGYPKSIKPTPYHCRCAVIGRDQGDVLVHSIMGLHPLTINFMNIVLVNASVKKG